MQADQTRVDSFTRFVAAAEADVRRALTAAYGNEAGREAAADAFAYAWQHWDRISEMDNPRGYIYRVGYNAGKRPSSAVLAFEVKEAADKLPWVEPGLAPALAGLPDQQRIVISLLHAFEWTMSEVASLLGVSKSTVQTHERRAMRKLRAELGVRA